MSKIKLKQIIVSIAVSLFFTACGGNIFSILDDGTEEKESEFQKYIVTREVKLDELVGKWIVDEASKKKYLKRSRGSSLFYVTDEEKEYKKELDESYIIVNKNASSTFKEPYGVEHEGKARSSNYIKEVYNHIEGYSQDVKEGAFLSISYRKKSSWGDIDLDCLEIDGVFYLGDKYSIGDLDAGNLEWRYTLYKKEK